jgi:hypothetical protein
MSRQTMIDAAVKLPRPPLYGIGSCRVGTDYLDFEIGWPEFERDTDWAESILRLAGIQAHDMLLATLANWECPWVSPLLHAVRRIGATYMTAEVYDWDARRVSMFLQRFPVTAVVGLGGPTVATLNRGQPSLAELLETVKVIWARSDAIADLAPHLPAVAPIVRLGPALAMGAPGRPGVLVNAREWHIDVDNEQLLISNVADRATRFTRYPTGTRGSVISADNEHIAIALEGDVVG